MPWLSRKISFQNKITIIITLFFIVILLFVSTTEGFHRIKRDMMIQHLRQKGKFTSVNTFLGNGRITGYTNILFSTSASASASKTKTKIPPQHALKPKHLALIFDINKTLIMVDSSGKKDIDHILNEILSEVAYGEKINNGKDWKWNGICLLDKSFEDQKSYLASTATATATSKQISYSNFIKEKYPDIKGTDISKSKAIRDKLKGTFTKHSPYGKYFQKEFHLLKSSLTRNNNNNNNNNDSNSMSIIPSFFEFLIALENRNISYSIQFRSFGDDINIVGKEFNTFCEGNHPLYKGIYLDGIRNKGYKKDHRINFDNNNDDKSICSFFRDEKGTYLIIGANNHLHHQQPKSYDDFQNKFMMIDDDQQPEVKNENENENVNEYGKEPNNNHNNNNKIQILDNYQDIYNFILQKSFSKKPTLLIRDYYPYWRENLEHDETGKLVLINENHSHVCQFITFDDNIELTYPHIIDVRCVSTGQMIPFHQTKNHILFKCEPYLSIMNPKVYFLNLISKFLPEEEN